MMSVLQQICSLLLAGVTITFNIHTPFSIVRVNNRNIDDYSNQGRLLGDQYNLLVRQGDRVTTLSAVLASPAHLSCLQYFLA